MGVRQIIPVVLRSFDGQYLAGHEGAWCFSQDLNEARVFDYIGDRIPEQLQMLEEDHGLSLSAMPLDPRERYETCDRCGARAMALRVYFDGRQFLCPACREIPPDRPNG
jgi:hypothetical protein